MSDKRYVLRAMTLEDAHKQGFSTKWFDERAKTRGELENFVAEVMWAEEEAVPIGYVDRAIDTLDMLVSWPTQDGP